MRNALELKSSFTFRLTILFNEFMFGDLIFKNVRNVY